MQHFNTKYYAQEEYIVSIWTAYSSWISATQGNFAKKLKWTKGTRTFALF